MSRRGTRWPIFARVTGHRFIHSCAVAGYSPGDAQDLVQGFFEHLFEHRTLSRADQEKGRLRTFLLGSSQNFLLKERERVTKRRS
jgi:DNA-directed RNA polymerase specialized sigma24 family protein